jgi:hypothetical protein
VSLIDILLGRLQVLLDVLDPMDVEQVVFLQLSELLIKSISTLEEQLVVVVVIVQLYQVKF